MFFDEDKKRMATTIIGKRDTKGNRLSGPAPLKPEVMKDEGGDVNPLHLAAEDILSAHHDKSAMKLVEALGNFINLHYGHDEGN